MTDLDIIIAAIQELYNDEPYEHPHEEIWSKLLAKLQELRAREYPR